MRVIFRLISIGCLLTVSSCASGGKNWWRDGSPEGPAGVGYGLEIVVDGVALPVYEHNGKSFVEGRMGERYTLRLHNQSHRRIEVVLGVDGRDVIDGQSYDPDRSGYVIEPHSSADIDGWRTSLQEVAAFRFTAPGDAYASRMGDSGDLGQIEAAVYVEREAPRGPIQLPGRPEQPAPAPPPMDRAAVEERSAEMAAGAPGASKRNLGTEFGELRSSWATETEFIRESSRPAARLFVRYDDAAGLCARGLQELCARPRPPLRPDAPPPQPDRTFSQPPPGWEHFAPWY